MSQSLWVFDRINQYHIFGADLPGTLNMKMSDFDDVVVVSSVDSPEFLNSTSFSVVKCQNSDQVIALCMPSEQFEGAWASKNSISLLQEIYVSKLRLGYSFFEAKYYGSCPTANWRLIRGRWNGWRSTSKSASNRVSGLADHGSLLAETLEYLSESMHNYPKWVLATLPSLPGRKVLEVGAGNGTMSKLISQQTSVTAWEPSTEARNELQVIAEKHVNIMVAQNLDEVTKLGPYDLIYLINVLEHVEFDIRLLKSLSSLLSKNGQIAIFSPAHNTLYSKFDQSIGHVRRYNKHRLKQTLQLAGFQPTTIRYFNPLGAVLWLISNRFLGTTSTANGAIKLYDRYFVPLGRLIELLRFRPFGQSVIAVGEHCDPEV